VCVIVRSEEDPDEARRVRRVYASYRGRAEERWTFANRGNLLMKHERNAILAASLQATGLTPLAGRAVLEIGCGSGGVLLFIRDLGAEEGDLHGVDLVPERLAVAMERLPRAHLSVANAERLDLPDQSADIVLLFGVLSSVLDPAIMARIAAEVMRVLSPRGAAFIYDFRIPNAVNSLTRPIRPAQVRGLFPHHRIEQRSLTVIPQLARRLGRFTDRLYPQLAKVALLRSHMLYVVRPLPRGAPQPGPLPGFRRLT
jgi:ubiquinone/menaquinone biosynthesis C-methylase UbiE